MTTSTTIEQSKRLIELGLDPCTADMVYISGAPPHLNVIDEEYIKREMLDEYDVLAWSLSALLEVMDEVSLDKHGDCYNMDFAYKGIFTDTHFDPIDAAVQMVEMMMAQGHIKKGGCHGV